MTVPSLVLSRGLLERCAGSVSEFSSTVLRCVVIPAMVILGALTQSSAWAGGSKTTGTLLVFAADSVTGKPVPGVDVTVRRPGWYVNDTHREPEWFAFTDSTGWARLGEIPVGTYEASLCQNTYDRRKFGVAIRQHAVDTLSVKLFYLGPPSDGRRCETRYQIPSKVRARKP